MKHFSLLILFFIAANSGFSQATPKIDQYWLVILKTGPKDKEITDTAERNKIFAGHFANIMRLYKEGIIKAAGPFGKNDLTWRGLFIFDCKTREDAENYVKTDPSVIAGVFITDIIPWYSEAVGSFVHGKPKDKTEN